MIDAKHADLMAAGRERNRVIRQNQRTMEAIKRDADKLEVEKFYVDPALAFDDAWGDAR